MKLFTKRSKEENAPVEYGAVSYWLTVIMIIMFVVVVVAAGSLRLMYRADARVALGNAKAMRMALVTTAIEALGEERPFSDPSQIGGVAEEVYSEVYALSKVPGDFMLIRAGEDGYGVEQFIYTEGPFFVSYTDSPTSWVVSYQYDIIHAVP